MTTRTVKQYKNVPSEDTATEIIAPSGSFGEILNTSLHPLVQIDAVYGLRDKTDVETFVDATASGSVSVDTSGGGAEFKCTTGTTSGGYGVIRSRRDVRYRPGQGQYFRFTARFTAGIASSIQRAGPMTVGDELTFGYNGTDFGILHRRYGKLEVQTLTLTAAASGAETGTVTLDGTAFPISLTSGTIAHNAYEFAQESYTGWDVFQNGNTVVFVALSVGDKTGSFSYSSDGTSAGTLAETAAGVAVTDTHYKKAEWNVNPNFGDGTSFTFDPTKGNVYEVKVQYLGYGSITFAIENPNSGKFEVVHRILYPNENTTPNLGQPIFKLGWLAASLGSTTDIATYGASAAGFVDANFNQFRNPVAQENIKSGVGTTLTNILSIRNRSIFNGRVNLSEIYPLLVSTAADGTKVVAIELWLNATLGGEPNWTYQDENHSTAEYDVSGTTVASNSDSQLLAAVSLGKTGSEDLDLESLGVVLSRNDVITIAAKTASGTSEIAASITWRED